MYRCTLLLSLALSPLPSLLLENLNADEPRVAAKSELKTPVEANSPAGADSKEGAAPVVGWLSAGEIVGRIQDKLGVPWDGTGNDDFKSGNADSKVGGITVTLFPTYEVLKQAAETGNNFVLCHEPLYYAGAAEMDADQNDPIVSEKQKLIDENNLVVFRFHDNIHRMKFDGIHRGMIDKLGWEDHRIEGSDEIFLFPAIKLGTLARELSAALDSQSIRVVGDPNQILTKVALSAGACGAKDQIKLLRREAVQLLVIGESREWQTIEYVRDAVDAGQDKSLIVLGHNASEEAGMNWCADWVSKFVSEIPVEFVASKEPYWTPDISR